MDPFPFFSRLRTLVTRQSTRCPVCAQPVEQRVDRAVYKAHDIPVTWYTGSWVYSTRRCWASGKGMAEIKQIYRTFASTLDHEDPTARLKIASRVELVGETDSMSLLAWSEINDEITARVLVSLDKESLRRFIDEALSIATERKLLDDEDLAKLKERH